ncbi:redoxin domain-containing protein [Candidatus Micrarchaeota archaeon]|nr:redoxin domain-containing protein [Candidatus Micrarchaeota archaeon]
MEGLPWLRIKAPGFPGIKAWYNSEPLTVEDLRGKAVLVDFWTYTCINCIRSMPHLQRWHEKYSKKGLVIIGVHSPEFKFEGDVRNIERAVKDIGIKYPVAADSGRETWNAFSNMYWPAEFLIDKEGYVQYVHFGEGGYAETERKIQGLLGISGETEKEEIPGYLFDQSPETYAGFGANLGLGSGLACDKSGCDRYVDGGEHDRNVIYPDGEWVQMEDYLELKGARGRISYKFNARQANVVIEPLEKGCDALVLLDGKEAGKLKLDNPGMYTVYQEKDYSEKDLSLEFSGKVRVYAFTFG